MLGAEEADSWYPFSLTEASGGCDLLQLHLPPHKNVIEASKGGPGQPASGVQTALAVCVGMGWGLLGFGRVFLGCGAASGMEGFLVGKFLQGKADSGSASGGPGWF